MVADAQFAREWENAAAAGIDRLEDEAHRRAVEGVSPRPICDKEGNEIGEIREYSDSLLTLLLRSRRPEVYARQPETTPRVSFNVTTTLEEARKRVADLGLPLLQIESDYEEEQKW